MESDTIQIRGKIQKQISQPNIRQSPFFDGKWGGISNFEKKNK
jgi:hypothetical protein